MHFQTMILDFEDFIVPCIAAVGYKGRFSIFEKILRWDTRDDFQNFRNAERFVAKIYINLKFIFVLQKNQ